MDDHLAILVRNIQMIIGAGPDVAQRHLGGLSDEAQVEFHKLTLDSPLSDIVAWLQRHDLLPEDAPMHEARASRSALAVVRAQERQKMH